MLRLGELSLKRRIRFWDAHVHLPAYPDPKPVIAGAAERGIRLVSVTVAPSEAMANLALKVAYPDTVRSFIGVHPSDAVGAEGAMEALAPLWEGADGVGEVGLDPKYSAVGGVSPQSAVFTAQVEVAERLAKPIQVHSRGAEPQCLDVLESHSVVSLLHWFEGEEHLGRALAMPRTFFSFGPAMLYSKKLQRIAARCPREAVLVESDGPVAFAPLGGPEGPGLLPSVAFKVAELWGLPLEEAADQLSRNTLAFLEEQG